MRAARHEKALFATAAALLSVACTWLDPLDDIDQSAKPDAGFADATVAAGADASADADAARSAFCASQDASFCEDFDEGTEVQGPRWTTTLLDQGTVSRAAPGDAPSPPNVLVASVHALDLNGPIKACLSRDFDVVPEEVHLDHYVRLSAGPADATVKLSVLSFGEYELELVLTAGNIGLKECYAPMGCVDPPYVPLPPRGQGGWMHVQIALQKGQDGGSGSIELRIDGKLLHQRAPASEAEGLRTGKLSLAVGIFYTGTSEPIEYAFDDVLLSYR